MTSEEWSAVKEVFEASRCLSAPMRDDYLSHSCTSETTRAEVESLLAAYAGDTEFLEEPALASLQPNSGTVPEFVGCYEISRSIGEGGMSTVYEGYRRDGHFQQRVAIKVLKRGMDTTALLLRFRTERQILAEFRHPHTAQLLDGGALPDGRPFLVMEYVEGDRITEFCDYQKLSIEGRLNLFLQVCSAVQAAHQNLIVHRDIKPSNILVTSEGHCKLLDFGIAKILEPARYQRTLAPTMASERLLTPEYASPEQVRGESITTASDVYSLGVLLYELIAGRSPHNFESRQLDVIARSMEAQITSPSAAISAAGRGQDVAANRATTPARLKRTLRGDLDNIVLRALREEPDRRYQSVEQMADDIRSYQRGLPVSARKETLRYLATKFFARNKAVSVVAILLLLAILAGTSGALWQAHRAERERKRAERRFSEMRKVANSLIFELHAAILPLRGSREAQELILRRATEMLDGLSKEAGNDAALALELAGGYRRLGDVQGNPLAENRGNTRAALRSYHEAVRLGKAAVALEPNSRAAKADLASSYQNLSSIAEASEAQSAITAAIQLHQQLLSEMPGDKDARGNLGVDYQRRGAVRSDKRNDFAGALRDELRSRDLLQQVADSPASNFRTWAQLSFAHKRVGSLLILDRRLDEAFKEFQAALVLDDRIAAAHPHDAVAEYNRTFTYSDLGEFYRIRGEFGKAIEYHRRALAIQESQAAADPGNERARRGVASTLSNLAFNLYSLGDFNGALDMQLKALPIAHGLVVEQPDSREARDELAKEEGLTAELLEYIAGHAPKTRCTADSETARDRVRKVYTVLQRLNPPPDIRTKLNSLSLQLSQCESPHP